MLDMAFIKLDRLRHVCIEGVPILTQVDMHSFTRLATIND